jgi:hypothetical protein
VSSDCQQEQIYFKNWFANGKNGHCSIYFSEKAKELSRFTLDIDAAMQFSLILANFSACISFNQTSFARQKSKFEREQFFSVNTQQLRI